MSLVFLKLGGSLITDKGATETIRPERIQQVAREVASAIEEAPDLALVIGHGSGSFGHVAANKYGTHNGVSGTDSWRGFAEVATVAARLNQIILENLAAVGLPVFRIQPSASAICRGGRLIEMATRPIEVALRENLVPLIYGDVSIDETQGGTIISTEAVFTYLARALHPNRILLAGDYDGVKDPNGGTIPVISLGNLPEIEQLLGASAWTDVTGGMASKVRTMLALSQSSPGLEAHIFSGQEPGQIRTALVQERLSFGTHISANPAHKR